MSSKISIDANKLYKKHNICSRSVVLILHCFTGDVTCVHIKYLLS